MSALIVPRVSLNGTPVELLIEARIQARIAIGAAFAALEDCAPHRRDYTHDTQSIEWNKARAVHDARSVQLNNLYTELETEAELLAAQRR